jgi:hypothetical protein
MYKSLKPLANAYAHITGYRQHGLRYDDLIIEEREDVQKVRFARGFEVGLGSWQGEMRSGTGGNGGEGRQGVYKS